MKNIFKSKNGIFLFFVWLFILVRLFFLGYFLTGLIYTVASLWCYNYIIKQEDGFDSGVDDAMND